MDQKSVTLLSAQAFLQFIFAILMKFDFINSLYYILFKYFIDSYIAISIEKMFQHYFLIAYYFSNYFFKRISSTNRRRYMMPQFSIRPEITVNPLLPCPETQIYIISIRVELFIKSVYFLHYFPRCKHTTSRNIICFNWERILF